MLYGVADGDVSVQRDGTQVHDGGGGEQHVQVDPDWTESAGERPGVVLITERRTKGREGKGRQGGEGGWRKKGGGLNNRLRPDNS